MFINGNSFLFAIISVSILPLTDFLYVFLGHNRTKLFLQEKSVKHADSFSNFDW